MHIPPDWGVFIALIVSFLFFWFIFGRLFFGPFLRLIGDRERRMRELSERTERLLRNERAAAEEREAQLAAVRIEALKRREDLRRRAEADAARLIGDAREAAKAELDQARQAIGREFEAAAGQLEQLAQRLAVELAARVLGRPVSDRRTALRS
jgi:F0F1-type ATP synthase membrane subunit b/b'